MFKPVARRVLAAEVFDQLRDRIVRGDLAAGAALPAERVLATMLKVNRNAVREGLKRLEQAGLVAISQGGATRVRDFRRSAGLGALSAMIVRADGTIDVGVVRSIVELRTELAPLIGRWAAERASKAEVAALEELVARMRGAHDDLTVLAPMALDFWAMAVAATGNISLELAFNTLAASYGGVMEQLQQVLADELRATDAYAALVTAIARRQPVPAGRAASAIARRGERAIGAVLDALDSVHRRNQRPRRR